MIENLMARFADYLRHNEFSISPAAVHEAIQLTPHLDMKDRFEFQSSLSQLWVKHPYEQEKFNECFKEFFFYQIQYKMQEVEQSVKAKQKLVWAEKEIQKAEKRRDKSNKNDKDKNGEDKHSSLSDSGKQWMKDTMVQINPTLNKLYEQAMKGQFKALIEEDKLSKYSPGDISKFAEELSWQAVLSEKPSIVFDLIQETTTFLLNMRKDIIKFKNQIKESISGIEKTELRGMRKVVQTEIDILKTRDIKGLSKEEVQLLREHIQATSDYFLTRVSKVLRKTKKQADIDAARTVRKSIETMGVPINLYYHRPKVDKTKIDIILDVSGSVIKSAEFLSHFAYLIHERFPSQVRVFAFVGLLDEVTDYYKNEDMQVAVKQSLKNANIDYRGYSNYDRALSMYHAEYGNELDQDTLLFFLADARNNRNSPRIDLMKEFREKAKHIFWFNPDTKRKWNQGDSVIGQYASYCDAVFETLNVKQLEEALYASIEYIEDSHKVMEA